MSAPIQGEFPTNPITAAKTLELVLQVQRDYGAVGDGTTDNTQAFADFTAGVGADGTGYVSAGTYSLTSMPTFVAAARYLFDPGAVLLLNGVPQQRVGYYHPAGTPINIRQETFASGSANTTTGSITANSNQLTLNSAHDFQLGQGISVTHAGTLPSIAAPSSATATAQGTTGSTTIQYAVAALDGKGGITEALTFSLTDANATLSASNSVSLAASVVSDADGYAWWRISTNGTSPTSTGFLGLSIEPTLSDTGLAVLTPPNFIPVNAPSAALGDGLVTQIIDGAGTTTLSLADAASNKASDTPVVHDDSNAWQSAVSALKTMQGGRIFVPEGTYVLGNYQPPPSGTSAIGRQAVIFSGLNDVEISGVNGAEINTAVAGNAAGALMFYNCQRIAISGLRFNASGTPSINTALTLFGCTDVAVDRLIVEGYGGSNLVGDWIFRMSLSNLFIEAQRDATGFDFYFLQDVLMQQCFFRNISTRGISHGFNVGYDSTNVNNNPTSETLRNGASNDIKVARCLFNGWTIGAGMADCVDSGFADCTFSTNTAYGVSIGSNTKTVPTQNVYIQDSQIYGGGGDAINMNTNGNSTIDITIEGNQIFDNTSSHPVNFAAGNITARAKSNRFFNRNTSNQSGAFGFGANLSLSSQIIQNLGFNPQAWAVTTLAVPSSTGSSNAVQNLNLYPVRIYQSGASGTHIIDNVGTDVALPDGAQNEIILQFGEKVYYATAVPSSWKWYGE